MGGTAGPLPGLSGAALLRAWEQGSGVVPVRRGAAMLAAVLPDLPVPAERLPIGVRDTLLLALRIHAFGPDLPAVAECPACGESVDVAADGGEILAVLPAPEPEVEAPWEPLAVAGRTVEFRPPDTLDLAAASGCGDVRAARALLIGRCVRGLASAPDDDTVDAIAARMAHADPAADITLRVSCPACAADWSAPLDVAEYVWAEVSAAAGGLLREVHELARRYGWTERDILAMSPARRGAYLDLP